MADYCISRFRRIQEQKLYRTYITDTLMYINNNLTKQFGGESITKRFIDILEPPKPANGDDIAVDVMSRAGLTFAEEQ